MTDKADYDVIIIGAGFGGMRMLHETRQSGLSAHVFEAGTDVGGTWYWNRYPGARTDTESWAYCFFFDEELNRGYDFQERFATQDQALDYLRYAADKLDMRKDITFSTRIEKAHYDAAANLWHVETNGGQKRSARYLVSASGLLSVAYKPPFPGGEKFKGETYVTSAWPKDEVSFEGKRVGVVGTGATAVQVIPIVAHTAKSLTVFQRTPNYVIPARNHPLSEQQQKHIKQSFDEMVETCHNQVFAFPMHDATHGFHDVSAQEQQRIVERGWETGGFRFLFETFNDILVDDECNEFCSEFVRNKIRAIVKDPKVAELLCPDYPLLAKRPPLGHYYYEAFNRENVELVDVANNPLEEVTEKGLRTGTDEYELDMIIYATGFDAATGALTNMDVRGREGVSLAEKWADGAHTNLGICVDGFPNFFMISGPQGPFANIPMVIDRTVNWIGHSMRHLEKSGHARIEPQPEAVTKWGEHLQMMLDATLLREGSGLHSWFLGANIPGKPVSVLFYFGGAPAYFQEIQQNIDEEFPGFAIA